MLHYKWASAFRIYAPHCFSLNEKTCLAFTMSYARERLRALSFFQQS